MGRLLGAPLLDLPMCTSPVIHQLRNLKTAQATDMYLVLTVHVFSINRTCI